MAVFYAHAAALEMKAPILDKTMCLKPHSNHNSPLDALTA